MAASFKERGAGAGTCFWMLSDDGELPQKVVSSTCCAQTRGLICLEWNLSVPATEFSILAQSTLRYESSSGGTHACNSSVECSKTVLAISGPMRACY
jgi:hypothetical protein